MNNLLEKLEAIYHRWLEIGEEITKPEVMADMKTFIKRSKDYKDLQPVVEAYKQYKNVIENIANTKEVISTEKDEEFREMAKMELESFIAQRDKLEEDIWQERQFELYAEGRRWFDLMRTDRVEKVMNAFFTDAIF